MQISKGETMSEELNQPSTFKQEWEAKKLLKRAKKKAHKELANQGFEKKEASGMIKTALNNIRSNKPTTRSAGRGR